MHTLYVCVCVFSVHTNMNMNGPERVRNVFPTEKILIAAHFSCFTFSLIFIFRYIAKHFSTLHVIRLLLLFAVCRRQRSRLLCAVC